MLGLPNRLRLSRSGAGSPGMKQHCVKMKHAGRHRQFVKKVTERHVTPELQWVKAHVEWDESMERDEKGKAQANQEVDEAAEGSEP